MKLLLVLTLIFTSAALGAVIDTHFEGENHDTNRAVEHGIKSLVINNLCTSSEQVTNAYSASTIGGAYDRWIAFDIIQTYPGWLEFDGFCSHWLYYSGLSDLGDTYFELYWEDLNSAPMYSFVVDANDIIETDSGLDAFGRDVYLTEYDFDSQYNDMFLDEGDYWFAVQMDTPSDNSFHVVRADSILDDLCWWYGDDAIWKNSRDAFQERTEGSYAIEGYYGS